MEPHIHNVLFLIGVQELDYGFSKLDQNTKTKVMNFASMYILSFLKEEDKNYLKTKYKDSHNEHKALEEIEKEIYKKGIINYFLIKGII
ncbi:MAG: hypothetical protein ACQESJ_09680 [Bacteroidota bacterium]